MAIKSYCITLLDIELEELKQVAVTYTNDRISSITCCAESIETDKVEFLISFDTWLNDSYTDYNPSQLPNVYTGKTVTNADTSVDIWLMKCTMDASKLRFICKPVSANSMLLLNEHVYSICEYAPKKLLVYTNKSELLLIIHNWKVIYEIEDKESRNIVKHWI